MQLFTLLKLNKFKSIMKITEKQINNYSYKIGKLSMIKSKKIYIQNLPTAD